jgi:hypothetical protein
MCNVPAVLTLCDSLPDGGKTSDHLSFLGSRAQCDGRKGRTYIYIYYGEAVLAGLIGKAEEGGSIIP